MKYQRDPSNLLDAMFQNGRNTKRHVMRNYSDVDIVGYCVFSCIIPCLILISGCKKFSNRMSCVFLITLYA